ncbi:hypothetical protein [Desulfotignum balticum]|uniref:hypothetical protein n=1 Tax=Desulfotignum balticum TaxID=115781 RepID=UPI0004629664|nr:hypothetical protein [Desulfotignum balticum]
MTSAPRTPHHSFTNQKVKPSRKAVGPSWALFLYGSIRALFFREFEFENGREMGNTHSPKFSFLDFLRGIIKLKKKALLNRNFRSLNKKNHQKTVCIRVQNG